jgi:RNA polymerase sigma-70 factor (ECF subfamily)
MSSFIRATQAEVWRLCRRLGDEASADDLTQDTYVRAMRSLPSFRGEASARTWLLAIARNTCADAVRANRRRRRRDVQDVAATTAPDHAGADAVERLIADLDLDRRAAFVLTQVLGLSYAEAAEVCDVPVGTIRSRVARARDELVTGLRAAAEG